MTDDTIMAEKPVKTALKEYMRWLSYSLAEQEAMERFEEVMDDIFENHVVEWGRIFKVQQIQIVL